jgi:hypothetical protein
MNILTIDTNILSKDLLDAMIAAAEGLGFEIAAVSVTHRKQLSVFAWFT